MSHRSLLLGAALLGLALASCRARWRPAGAETEPVAASPAAATHLEAEAGTDPAEGHHDFPYGLETVWNATVESIHATGVPVPRSASFSRGADASGSGLIDVDELRVRLVSRGAESTCVLVRYWEPSGEAGGELARELLAEIERRARAIHSAPEGAR